MTEYTQESFVDIPPPSVIEDAQVYGDKEKAHQRAEDYARQLWTQLNDVATYLRQDLARGAVLTTDEQWARWQEVYARSLSLLAGPNGDSGYGQSQAVLERQFGQQN